MDRERQDFEIGPQSSRSSDTVAVDRNEATHARLGRSGPGRDARTKSPDDGQPRVWYVAGVLARRESIALAVPEGGRKLTAILVCRTGPVTGPSPYTTDTLYAGLQMVLPGETAPAHRHIAYAVRFIQESDKGFTSVAGHKMYLEHGDLVLTPSWQWHYHGNDGPSPTIWVDCLDIPLQIYGRTNFLEPYQTKTVPDLYVLFP